MTSRLDPAALHGVQAVTAAPRAHRVVIWPFDVLRNWRGFSLEIEFGRDKWRDNQQRFVDMAVGLGHDPTDFLLVEVTHPTNPYPACAERSLRIFSRTVGLRHPWT